MNTSTTKIQVARAQHIIISEDSLTANLDDGSAISVPLAWYPRLAQGSPDERNN